MAETMREVIIYDGAGKRLKYFSREGYIVPMFSHTAEALKSIHEAMPDMKLREDDVLLCSFPKTGTNWMFEVISMVLNKSDERVKGSKMMSTLEAQTQQALEELPSPRVLNTHMNYRFLPNDMRAKQTKTVLICRNPKDTAVSYFHHMKGIKLYDYDSGQWKDWLGPYVNSGYGYLKYTDYLKEWEQAMSSGAGFPLHVIYYEDMKLNGKEEIDKLCKFLDTDLDETLKLDIIRACSFDKMSTVMDDSNLEKKSKIFRKEFSLLRKGQVGDWKNWFTVQQNETFDIIWEKEMKDSNKFVFTYEANQ